MISALWGAIAEGIGEGTPFLVHLIRNAFKSHIRGRGETVDARDLKSLGSNPVWVQVPPSAPGAWAPWWNCRSTAGAH